MCVLLIAPAEVLTPGISLLPEDFQQLFCGAQTLVVCELVLQNEQCST